MTMGKIKKGMKPYALESNSLTLGELLIVASLSSNCSSTRYLYEPFYEALYILLLMLSTCSVGKGLLTSSFLMARVISKSLGLAGDTLLVSL